MNLDVEARLEAAQIINQIRARGGCIVMMYKPNLKDRYLQVIPKFTPVPCDLSNRFVAHANEIAKILIEEAHETSSET